MKTSKHMWMRVVSALLVLVMVAAFVLPNIHVSAADTDADLWIDPVNGSDTNDGTTEGTALKTIQAAKTKAAELSADQDVVVILKAGTYDASETIVFGEEDSGKNGHTITYRAASGEKAIISGGASVEGWTLHDAEKNIYVADIPEGAELVRSFYVDGVVQTMAYMEQSPIDWEVLSSGGYRSPIVTSDDNHEYLIFDLGEDKLVSGLTLYAGSERAGDGNAAAFPKDFTIQTSSDGVHWSTQVTENDCIAPIARSAKSFEFPAVGARYIKLDVTQLGNTTRTGAGKYHLALSEVLIGLTSKENKLNLSLVQHLDMSNPAAVAYGISMTAGTAKEIEVGTAATAVSGISLICDDLNNVRGNMTVEAFDGENWTTVLTKKNYLFSSENTIAFNPVAATKLRVTTSFNVSAGIMAVYKPATISAGATVTANGQNADKLTDGKFDAIYNGPSYMTPVAGDSDLVVNLGSVQDVGAVRLYPTYVDGKVSGYLKAARILVSKDGETYTTAAELANMDVPAFGAQLLLLPNGVKAQYIKIQPLLLSGTGNDYRLQLEEIEVVTTKVEVDENNNGPTVGYKPVYNPVPLAGATPILGYYADVNNLDGKPVDAQAEHVTTPGEEAGCIIDKKANSHGWSAMVKYKDMVAHGGTKVPAFYVEFGTATPMNTIDVVMDKDIWGAPRTYKIQVYDGTEWITVAEAENVEWSAQNYSIHAEFETVNASAARILAYDLYMTDGIYPEDMAANMETSTRFILNEFNPQLMELIPYEIDNTQESPTIKYDKYALGKDNVAGFGYYRTAERDEVIPYYAGSNNDPNLAALDAATRNMFDGNKDTYGSSSAQQYQWIPPIGPNTPVLVLDLAKTNGGLPVNINAIELVVREDGRNAPYNYIIQVTTSAEKDNWTTLVEETGKDWGISNEELYKFSAMEIYKLRLVSTFTTPDANIPLDNCYGSVYTSLQIAELAVYNINDPTNPVAENLCTQGEKASGSQTYDVYSAEAKNDNPENMYNANKTIDGYIDPVNENGFVVPEKYDFDQLWHPEYVEMHTLYLWYHNMEHFTGVSGDGTEIYLETGLMPTWVANDYLFIDTVGEWYIDRDTSKIYYKADGTMDGKEAVLPVTERIISMEYAANIKFEGITFSHTTWTHPSTYAYNDQQANCYYEEGKWKQVPAGMLLNGCQNIVFDDCDLTNMGTAGIKIKSDGTKHSDGNQIINSRIHDIGYSGIIIGEAYGHHGYQNYMLVKNTLIQNNYVTRVGLENRDSPGIVACYTNGTVIDHNEVAFCPYTGISTGWGWDSEEFGVSGSYAPNQAFLAEVGNIQVTYNLVHDTGKNNRDGGSIYNLGSSKGSVIAYNYIYNSWDGDDVFENGLYLDQGSAHFEVHHNVIGENVGYWMHQWMYTIHDNVWHDNYYVETKSRDNGTNNEAYSNYMFDDQADLMTSPEAVEIMNGAGLMDDAVKASVWEGFATIQDVVQEFWPGENSRYFEPDWGWDDVAIAGQVGRTIYDSISKKASIIVKQDADITALALMFNLYDGWTCDKVSGSVQDFTNPVTYTLTNGKETVIWTVNVKQQVDSGGEIPGEEVNLGDIIANYEPGQWTEEPARVANGIMHLSGHTGYVEEYFGGDTIFTFDVTFDLQSNSEFVALSLKNQDPTLDWSNGSTEYMINFNKDTIEVQKFLGGARTVYFGEMADHVAVYGTLPNNFFTPNEVHSVKCGAIDVAEGVRLFLYIDGNLVFDIMDTTDPITAGGYFAVYANSQTMSFRAFSDKQNTPDMTEYEWALYVIESLNVLDYKQETWGNLQSAIVNVTEIMAANGGVTQDMVDTCTRILWEALDSLEQVDGTSGAIVPDRPLPPGELDWSAYDSVYNLLLSLDLYAYTPESMTELFAAVDRVNVILAKEDITQADIDEATKLLVSGIKALKSVNGGYVAPAVRPEGLDYTMIDAAMGVAYSAIESNYSAATYAALQEAIYNAYEAMTDANATQKSINAAYVALVDAITNLEYIGAGLQPIVPPVRVPEQDGGNTGNNGGNGGSTTDPDQPGKEDSDVPSGGDDTPNGKTGDDFMMTTWIILLAIGLVGAAAVVVLLKKNNAR